MTNKNGATYTPKVPECYSEHQTGRQQAPHLSNHNGHHQLHPTSYQTAATYQNGPPYPDADQFCREFGHECDDGAGQPEARRSTYQTPHDRGRRATHQAEPEQGNARPYGRVDRTPYNTVSAVRGNGPEHRRSGGHAAAGSQAHNPMQRFQNEPMKEMTWNSVDSFQPIGTPNAGEGRKEQQHYSAGSSVKAENGSSTSFWSPYQG